VHITPLTTTTPNEGKMSTEFFLTHICNTYNTKTRLVDHLLQILPFIMTSETLVETIAVLGCVQYTFTPPLAIEVLSLAFEVLSLTIQVPSLAFEVLSLTFEVLSLTIRVLSLTFEVLSLAIQVLSLNGTKISEVKFVFHASENCYISAICGMGMFVFSDF
jgi:uncharacterized metal-binding protein